MKEHKCSDHRCHIRIQNGREGPLKPGEAVGPVLTNDDALRLAELGIAIERESGAPQETEWAFGPDGKIWILQSRPIRTIKRPPGRSRP